MKYALLNYVKILRLKKLYFFVLLILFDYFFYDTLSGNRTNSNIEPGRKSKKTKRVTIDDLMAKKDLPFNSLAKLPNRDPNRAEERDRFSYRRVECPQKTVTITGYSNQFQICYPPRNSLREEQRLAYFINGFRDFEFERNFKRLIGPKNFLKIFTKNKPPKENTLYEKPDTVQYVDVRIYTDSDSENEIGIKDLIDLNDDYHNMEFLKYEMINETDPIVFSINIPVFSAHILLRLQGFDYEEIRYVIKRLNYAVYYPYSVEKGTTGDVIFIAFMHKFSLNKYGIDKIIDSAWMKQGTHGME